MNDKAVAATPPAPAPADRRKKLETLRKMINEGASEVALQALDHELKLAPNDADYWLLKSLAFGGLTRYDDAYEALGKAIELRPGAVELRLEQSRFARLRGNDADEVAALTAAIGMGGVPEQAILRLVNLHAIRKEWAQALAIADRLVQLKPGHEPYVLKRAAVLVDSGKLAEAKKCLDELVDCDQPTELALSTWAGVVADRVGDLPAVIAKMELLLARGNKSWLVYLVLGKALAKIERPHEGMEMIQRSVEADPNRASSWFDLGVLQRQLGQVEASQRSINRSLELDPTNAGALRIAGYEHKYAYGDDAFKRVNVALSRVDKMTRTQQVEVHYAAAKALEDVGEVEAAFGQYARAGRIQKEVAPWSDTRMRGVLALMKNFVRPQDFEAVRAQATHTDKPVFVFGMPRSGTTLLEQVIASHPQAFGAGELKLGAGILNGIQLGRARLETMYDGTAGTLADGDKLTVPQRGLKYLEVIEGIAGTAPLRVVDKMPGNYNWVGLLDAVLPGAHFIHSRRHPVEICLSEYRIYFPDGINFSYDLRDLGKAYRLYNDYVKYWSKMMGDKILHVRYEDMVADLETQARRIISFIGLPWDDACLRFYESDRKVLTASVTQVRKPIYTTSTNRWRKYEPHLKPLLEELGPLVAEYEEELAKADAERQIAA